MGLWYSCTCMGLNNEVMIRMIIEVIMIILIIIIIIITIVKTLLIMIN